MSYSLPVELILHISSILLAAISCTRYLKNIGQEYCILYGRPYRSRLRQKQSTSTRNVGWSVDCLDWFYNIKCVPS